MSDVKRNADEEEVEVYTLTDEETGEQQDFIIDDEVVIDGKHFYALVSLDEEDENYYIFRVVEEGDDPMLEFVGEDSEDFEKVAAYFDSNVDVDYDK